MLFQHTPSHPGIDVHSGFHISATYAPPVAYRRLGPPVRNPASFSGDPEYESRPTDRLSLLRFTVGFLDPLRQILGQCLQLDRDRFLPHFFYSLFTITT
jgi:hypothetical protein